MPSIFVFLQLHSTCTGIVQEFLSTLFKVLGGLQSTCTGIVQDSLQAFQCTTFSVAIYMHGYSAVSYTHLTSLLAVAMQRKGFKTAVLDADITGPSIPKAFGLHGKATGDNNGIYPVMTKTGIEVMSVNLPVSYTHLDVYKRQLSPLPPLEKGEVARLI